MKIHLHTIGCRLNQAEIETMARQLATGGHAIVNDVAEADTIILNTCAVTAEATRDARNLTRRFHRANAAAGIVLTGCYATIAPDEVAALPGVGRVVGNADKDRLPLLLDPTLAADAPLFDREPLARETQTGAFGRTRGFVKVQDGCDNRCTFCVTTIARGVGRSRSLADVVSEVQRFAAAGYGEVVLTGVHLGSYGRDLGRTEGLRELLAALLAHTEIPRIRLSSLEPWEIAEGFFRLWENPRLLPHLHLPLQSGSDRVLRRMARRTSRAAFCALAAEARAPHPRSQPEHRSHCRFPRRDGRRVRRDPGLRRGTRLRPAPRLQLQFPPGHGRGPYARPSCPAPRSASGRLNSSSWASG